jgi:hypothetical protein
MSQAIPAGERRAVIIGAMQTRDRQDYCGAVRDRSDDHR